MNNSVFGKTMENVRNRKDVKLLRCNSEKEINKIRKIIASPCFAEANIFNENVAAILMYKTTPEAQPTDIRRNSYFRLG